MINRVKEAFDISIHYPVHAFAGDRHAQCIECIVLAKTRPKAIAETEKTLLVDALQHPQHRLLDNLIFQRSDAQWPLLTVGLGNPQATRGMSSVGSPVNPIVEVRNVDLQVPLVFVPRYAVHADCRRSLQVEEAFGQTLFVDVMQQAVNLSVLSLRAASRTPCRPRDLPWVRLGVRDRVDCTAFLLAESLSSIDSADASAASLFADVESTTDSSDFLLAFMSAVPPVAFANRSACR